MNNDNLKNTSLKVKIFNSRDELGREAAADAGEYLRNLLNKKDKVNVIFAAAPSQNEFLKYLTEEKGIDWGRINAFHMDEYIGLKKDAPQGFGNFLKMHIFDKLPFASVNLINGQAEKLEKESERYGQLLAENPVDVVCMGIGENGHIAFNDPPVADFEDKKKIKVVELDNICRQQQVNDGCFLTFNDVPEKAFTLTIPSLMKASAIFCVVPGERKAEAVANTFNQQVISKYPSTILRTHNNAVLYLDKQSSQKL
jgi:glucosamine-6-phosphate deaminase